MTPFDLGIRLVAGYSVFSLLLSLLIFPSDFEAEPAWASRGSHLAGVLQVKTDNVKITTPVSTRFFPSYGTQEFFQQCDWAAQRSDIIRNCTFLVRPPPDMDEGISHWISQIVSGHHLAQQTGCSLFFDYGPDIDIQQVLTPFPTMDGFQAVNWTAPVGFDCNGTYPSACFLPRPAYSLTKALEYYEDTLNMNLSAIPNYRTAYRVSPDYFRQQHEFQDIQSALPGFKLDTAMACSLGSLFHLAPHADQFEPNLFSRILPTLHQPKTLVMSLYIRTGLTDVEAKAEKIGDNAQEGTHSAQNYAKKIANCAVGLEQEYLSNNTSYSRVVWMVVTDSHYLKKWVPETYNSREVNSTSIPREVVTTRSRGVHSRASRDPSTADFAEALIDWYLIGESDLVICDGIMAPSFADTAALRTARPLYKIQGYPQFCGKAKIWDHTS